MGRAEIGMRGPVIGRGQLRGLGSALRGAGKPPAPGRQAARGRRQIIYWEAGKLLNLTLVKGRCQFDICSQHLSN